MVLLRPAFRTGGKLRALGRKVLSHLVCLKRSSLWAHREALISCGQ